MEAIFRIPVDYAEGKNRAKRPIIRCQDEVSHMQFGYSPYILLPCAALFIAIILIFRSWRHRATPIARTFIILMSALAWWSLAVALEHASLVLGAKIFWVKISYFGVAVLPTAWLAFTLQYANKENWL